MAVVNRYTKVSQPRFNPMSLQELMISPAYKRGQHDSILGQIAETETALAQVNPLDVHSDLVKQEQERLYGKLDAQAQALADSGFTNATKGEVVKLNKDYQQSVGPTGLLGRANAAKTALEAEKEAYIQNATKMGYSPEQAGINWNRHVQKYRESFDGKTIKNISSMYAPEYHNVVEEFRSLLKDSGYTAETIANDLGTSYIVQDPATGTYVVTKEGYEKYKNNTSQIQSALDYMNNQINNANSPVYKSIEHQGKTSKDALDEIMGLKDVYLKSERDWGKGRKISNFSPGSALGVPTNADLKHESDEAVGIKTGLENLSSKLGDILSSKTIDTRPPEHGASAGVGLLNPNALPSRKTTATFENRMSPDEIRQYKDLTERMKKVDPSLQALDWDDPQLASAAQQYIEQNKDILHQDNIITDDFVTDYGDNSIGLHSTDGDKMAKLVQSERLYRKYKIEGDDTVYDYDQLPSDLKKRFDNMTYSGYYSPKNFLTDSYGQHQDKDMFVSPIAMVDVNPDNGKARRVIVSRSAGERSKPTYKADSEFNDIFVNTNKWAGLPYRIPNTTVDIVYDPNRQVYVLNKQQADGSYSNPVTLTEEQLQNSIYAKHKVILPSQVSKKKR